MHAGTDCHHRRRPGRRAGRPDACAPRALPAPSPWSATRPIRPISARRCPRPICWASFERERLFLKPDAFYRRSGLRSDPERRAPRPSTARQRPWRWPTAARSPTTSCCSRPARGCASSNVPAPTCRACIICATSPMWTGCRRVFQAGRAHRHCRRRLYRAGSGGGGRQARPRCHRVRGDGPADGARGLAGRCRTSMPPSMQRRA